MKKQLILPAMTVALSSFLLFSCNSSQTGQNNSNATSGTTAATASQYGGFSTQVAWGKHLVSIGGCGDCHTPKIMTKMGPMPDTTMYLAGHPANVPPPKVNRKEMESKGLIVTNDLSVWIGPWGITYTANLTPDKKTGIGNWTADQFIRAIREGKENGSPEGRSLLPPMSFVAAELGHSASDNELKAIFAYLQSIKPVSNAVPGPVPPVMARKHS